MCVCVLCVALCGGVCLCVCVCVCFFLLVVCVGVVLGICVCVCVFVVDVVSFCVVVDRGALFVFICFFVCCVFVVVSFVSGLESFYWSGELTWGAL